MLRWQLEVTFQEVRAHLGVETQRQWSDRAIARTTPILMGLFSWTTLAAHLMQEQQPMSHRIAAWYAKPSPTFVDAIALVRRHLWLASEGFSLSNAEPGLCTLEQHTRGRYSVERKSRGMPLPIDTRCGSPNGSLCKPVRAGISCASLTPDFVRLFWTLSITDAPHHPPPCCRPSHPIHARRDAFRRHHSAFGIQPCGDHSDTGLRPAQAPLAGSYLQ